MAVEQLTKQGIIFLTAALPATKARSGSAERPVERGYITFASIGSIALTFAPFQVYASLRLIRTEGLTDLSYGTICYGYVSAEFTPYFTGRIPVFPGDILIMAGMSDVATTIAATIRFEEA